MSETKLTTGMNDLFPGYDLRSTVLVYRFVAQNSEARAYKLLRRLLCTLSRYIKICKLAKKMNVAMP